ncbi:hypothetical protein SGPA1_30617 [Streptomyces misionensis JCM 4497]
MDPLPDRGAVGQRTGAVRRPVRAVRPLAAQLRADRPRHHPRHPPAGLARRVRPRPHPLPAREQGVLRHPRHPARPGRRHLRAELRAGVHAGLDLHAARPDRADPVLGVRLLRLPAVLPRVPEGTGGRGAGRRARILADVLAGGRPERAAGVRGGRHHRLPRRLELLPVAAGDRAGPERLDGPGGAVLLHHRPSGAAARAVHRGGGVDPAAAAGVPVLPAVDRGGGGALGDRLTPAAQRLPVRCAKTTTLPW